MRTIRQSLHRLRVPKQWGLLLLLGLLWPLGRWGVGLYHQTRGVWLVVQALQAETAHLNSNTGVWLPAPLTTPLARQWTAEAAAHFQAALRVSPGSRQAARWAGRSAALLDHPDEALKYCSQVVNRTPSDQLGWWELGLAYERWAGRAGIFPADTLTQDPALEIQRLPVPATVVWGLPNAASPGRDWWTPATPVTRSVLVMTAPDQLLITATLPVTPTALLFWVGLEPSSSAGAEGQVRYRLWVNNTVVFTYTLSAAAGQQGWYPASVDLSNWQGEIQLRLAVDLLPASETVTLEAGWGDLQWVPAATAAYRQTEPVARAIAAWQRGGVRAQDFIRIGNGARTYLYPGAMAWYGRAVWLNPEQGEAWYQAGLAYELQKEWTAALAMYERALHKPLSQVGISTVYYRMGLTYQQMQDRQYWELVLQYYERALALQAFNTQAESADCHYNYGAVWLWQTGDWDRAMAEFEAALALYPTHAGAHLMRGWGLYQRDGNEAEAEQEMLIAVALAPQGAWVYHNLGEFYRLTGRTAEARLQYQKALALNPTLQQAREALTTLEDTRP